jgi:eukaryotic-like serine/threonine-protein kinase
MNTSTNKQLDSLLGYRLVRKIGAGGFGEVWQAEAPGGLAKAVKILSGCQGDRRASLEMRSLDRVKQLRHPFLLSLERIEYVDDRLVIVTELADRSLADVFEAYGKQEIVGIPRQELLDYLSQIAQALDFLAFEHGLQHLDVKPENFLLVGQHAKLADFGLVKEVQDSGQSLLGGMTPNYAAPELFDGRPSRFSDQYSLAIVYQEMLTGERPFGGGTTAQLAAQHLHGKPNLSRLPANDQKVIARALHKEPEMRFKSCRELIDELRQKKTLVLPGRKQVGGRRATAADSSGKSDRSFHPAVTQPMSQPARKQAGPLKIVDVPSIVDVPGGTSCSALFAPILLVGVGQLGTEVLRSFKARVAQQFGDCSELPAVDVLALDSDRNALVEANQAGGANSLESHQTVHLPLRRPEAYRDSSQDFGKWLNRRWIYNVPKSLQTEGLRPLGRLALVDNFDNLWEQLKARIEQITRPDAVAQTVARLDLEPSHESPRIVLVGAISGGIGSGTILDLAYLAKLLLLEQGYSGDNVHGILLHSSESAGRDAGLNTANTFAFLTELRQYMRDGYPGEATCGIPQLPAEPPFGHVYLQPLEAFETPEQLSAKLNSVANYLVLSNLTPAQPFFENCRALDRERSSFGFRSFGMSMLGLGYSADTQRVTARLVQPILDRWCGQNPKPPKELPDLEQLLPTKENSERILDVVHRRLLPRHQINKALAETMQNSGAGTAAWRKPIDQLFGFQEEEHPEVYLGNGQVNTQQVVEEVFRDIYLLLRQSTQKDFTDSRLDLELISWKWSELQRRAQRQYNDVPGQIEKATRQMLEQEEFVGRQLATRANDRMVLMSALESYIQARYRHLAAVCNKELQRRLCRAVEECRADVERIRLRISAGVKSFQMAHGQGAELDADAELQLRILQTYETELLSRIELRFYHETVVPRGNFWEIARDPAIFQAQLLPALFKAAAHEVAEAGRTIRPEHLNQVTNTEESLWGTPVRQLLSKCQPFSEHLGGEARLLLGVPKGNDPESARSVLEQQAGARAAAVNLNSSDLVLISEIDQISFADFALNLLCERSDCAEVASRLHVRADLRWSSLQDLF